MSLILTGTASGKEAKPQKSGPRLGGTPGITRLCRLRVYPKPSRSLANQRHFFEGTRGSVAIRVDPGRWDEAAARDADGPRRSDPAEEPPRSARCRVRRFSQVESAPISRDLEPIKPTARQVLSKVVSFRFTLP